MIIDVHAYWDAHNMPLEKLRAELQHHGLSHVMLSAPCTQGFEPDKSPFMYAVQRTLLRNSLLRPLAEFVSTSFYNARGELRSFWKLFTRNSNPINKIVNPDNEQLLRAISSFSEMYAWCWLNPTYLPSNHSLNKLLQHPKVVGVKLHAYWHTFDISEARQVFALAEHYHMPLYLILGFGWLKSLHQLLIEFPSIDVIIGYGGFPYFDTLWETILPFSKVRIDLTSFHIDAKGIRDAVHILGASRCLYGSDCPYNFKDNGKFSYAKTFERICQSDFSKTDQDAIFSQNAKALFRTLHSTMERVTL